MLIDRPVKIVPGTLDCDVSLVDTPRAADGSREPTPTLLELGRVANDPAHDGGVRNHNAALRHHRGQISVTQLVRDVPAHRQNYDLGVEVPLQIDRVTPQRLRHQSLPRRPYRTTLRRCTRTSSRKFTFYKSNFNELHPRSNASCIYLWPGVWGQGLRLTAADGDLKSTVSE